MPKKPDERIIQAKQMYLDGMKLVEIASQLSLPEGTVRRWKSTHKWDNERSDKKNANVRKKRGGQKGNKNATGPPGNKHAEKHGFFSKWLPAETLEIINAMSDDPLESIWDTLTFQYAAIVRAQNLMYVKNQADKTVEKVGESSGNVDSETWTVQQAWDKHSTFMSAQARSVKAFLSTVKEYEELLNKRWDLATDIQKARIDQLKAQTRKLEDSDKEQPINITFTKASEKNDKTS